MTTTASNSNFTGQFPFDFVPQPTGDRELLNQLNFIPGLKELLTIRQVHALEHGTVWVLSQMASSDNQQVDNELLGGSSTENGFYLYGTVDSVALRQAVNSALQRLTGGEWNLGVHPRCGTNISVGLLLTGGLAFGINWLLPKGPIEQFLGLGLAATFSYHLAPDVGGWVQRYFTTAIPFNLKICEIAPIQDIWGRSAHFVRVEWID